MEFLVIFVALLIWLVVENDNKRKKRIKEEYAAQPVSERMDVPGSAKFITEEKDLKTSGLLGRKGVIVGYSIKGDRTIRFDQDCHSTVIAPSGTFKTTAFGITNVLDRDDCSLFVMDVKTEICPVTIAHRARLGPVWILNAHHTNTGYLKGYELAQYNPMARLCDPKEPRLNIGPVAMKIADGSMMAESSAEFENFWNSGAHGALAGLMIGQARYGDPDERTLPAVRRMLSNNFVAHCERFLEKNDPLVTDLLGQFVTGKKDRTSIEDIVITANVKTRFLSDEGVVRMLSGSTFKFGQLKQRVSTAYLCGNLDFIDVTRSQARLITTCAISELQRPDIKSKVPVWMLCDETYHYGYSSSIETSYGAIRGSGVRMCTIWTDTAQIEKRYGVMSRSIIGNSGAVITMQPGDDQTAAFMSRQAGMSTIVTATPSVCLREGYPQTTWSKQVSQQELLPLAMAMKIPADRMLVFVRGIGPVLTKKVPYFKTRLKRRAGKNPYAPGGGLFKKLLGR